MINKHQLEGYIGDMFSNFLYYDRKEDEDFTIEDAENLMDIVDVDELKAMFCKQIDDTFKQGE